MIYDAFHQKVKAAFDAKNFEACDKLINECPDPYGECGICADICCPHHDSFHFHHDGCPSCAEPIEYTQEQVDAMNDALHGRGSHDS